MAKTRTRPSSRRPPAKKRRTTTASRAARPSQTAKALSPHKGDIQGVPVLVAGLGIAMFRRSVAPAGDPIAARVMIGLLAVLLGGLGLIHLSRGNPPVSARAAVLQGSGGWVGAAIAHPAARLLSVWGGRAAFACLLFLGLLISTRTSVASVGRGAARLLLMLRTLLTPPQTAPDQQAAEAGGKGAGRRGALPAPSARKPVRPEAADSATVLQDLGGDVEDGSAKRRSRRR